MASIYFCGLYVCVCGMRHLRLTRINVTIKRYVVSLKNVNKQMHKTTLFLTHQLFFRTYSNIHNKNRWVLFIDMFVCLPPKEKQNNHWIRMIEMAKLSFGAKSFSFHFPALVTNFIAFLNVFHSRSIQMGRD